MPEDKFTALVDRVKSAVATEGKGELLLNDDWGKAKIAFPINKENRGKWTYFRYKSLAGGVDEVRRALGINEFVLRQVTTRTNEDGKDYETLREAMPQELLDREKVRDWKESRFGGRGGYGDRGGRGGGYGDRGGRGGYGSRDSGPGNDDGDVEFGGGGEGGDVSN